MTIKLLLWNVDLTPNLSIFSPFRNSKERYPQISAIINEFDIVVLNECFLYREQLMELSTHMYNYTDSKPWYKFFNSGIVILSKYPFSQEMTHHFNSISYWDRFISKGILKVSFKINEKKFDLYGTHMQQYNDDDAQRSRLAQVNETINFINSTNVPGNDIILVGDFNMGPVFDKEYKTYSVHYSNSEDAKLRNEQYEILVRGVNLINYIEEEDICHMFHRGNTLTPKRLNVPDFKLSDTGAYCLEL